MFRSTGERKTTTMDWYKGAASIIRTVLAVLIGWCKRPAMFLVTFLVTRNWFIRLAAFLSAFLAALKTTVRTVFTVVGEWCRQPTTFMAAFALWNIAMYLLVQRYWVGGSSFLPLIGQLGPEHKFLFVLVVNVGMIAGAFLGAQAGKEFQLRKLQCDLLFRMILGGALIGAGITLAPGTGTTAFLTGIPMLSVSSFLSVAGIILGALIMFRLDGGRAVL